jgi:ABC-type lipoprotein export system ATPase subunit
MELEDNNKKYKIKKIKVESLFGLFDYDIPLKESGITILIGVNGSGKTTIFNILNSTLKAEFYNILNIDFKSFEIEFTNGYIIKIRKKLQVKNCNDLLFHMNNDRWNSLVYDKEDTRKLRTINRYTNKLQKLHEESKVLADFSIEIQSNGFGESHQLIKKTEDREKGITYEVIDLPKKILDFWNELNLNSHLIETQRLQSRRVVSEKRVISEGAEYKIIHRKVTPSRNQKMIDYEPFDESYKVIILNRINEYARELSDNIKSKRSDYFAESQNVEKNTLYEFLDKPAINYKDSSFKVEISDIYEEIKKMEDHIKKLREMGIYDLSEVKIINDYGLNKKIKDLLEQNKAFSHKDKYSEEGLNKFLDFSLKSSLLTLYATNTIKKLDIFTNLEKKIEIFLNSVNSLFIPNHKKMEIDLEKGFIFKLKSRQGEDRVIDPSYLSSGEQHEVILNYELVFNTDSGSLILIDEPEISLHISWQRKFVSNLLEIAKENNLNIIIATHSPDIVDKHRNLVHVLNDIYCNEA